MAGWYWYKEGKEIAVLTFVSRGLEMAFSMPLTINARHSYPNWSVRTLAYMVGEWLGPITPDSYQQGRVEGLREAAGMVDDDCYIPGGELLPDFEHRCKHNVNQKELAGKIRFRANDLAQQAQKGVAL